MVYLCYQLVSPQVEGEWEVVGRTPSPPKGVPISKHVEVLDRNKNMVIRNQDWLCCGEPFAIYPTDRPTNIVSKDSLPNSQKKAAAVTLLNQIKPSSYPGTLHFCDNFNNIIISLPVYLKWYLPFGRALAQAVSRRHPTAAARVQTRVWSCGILWWTKVALGQVFSEYLGFPCQSTFHLPHHNHLHYHPRLAQ
jgi:hypothetical protein